MRWSYKTVHFSPKKEGLLGGAFLDEVEIEETLNDFGSSGWELVSIVEVSDGLMAVFKQGLAQRSVLTVNEDDMVNCQDSPDLKENITDSDKNDQNRSVGGTFDEPDEKETVGKIKIM